MSGSKFFEDIVFEEVTEAGRLLVQVSRGLRMGDFLKQLRKRLGMPQKVLAKRSGVPQSTISSVENNKLGSIALVEKMLEAMNCTLAIAPNLNEPIEKMRRKEAERIARKRVEYLKGTMSLEDQLPNERYLERLVEKEIQSLLEGSKSKIWEE